MWMQKKPSTGSDQLATRPPWKRQFESMKDALAPLNTVSDLRVLASLVPSATRGLFLDTAVDVVTTTPARHSAHFDWSYPHDFSEVEKLYSRAKTLQWDASTALKWDTQVDPDNDAVAILPPDFFNFEAARELGVHLDEKEQRRFRTAFVTWMISQFLHGEQGALYAAAQVVESVPFFDGKKFAATQVMDEARHVEAFSRYLDTKLQGRYPINRNLFVVIDALCGDARWDLKFLGMQILVEGLALSAFGSLYKRTKEPLLKEMLGKVLEDEARHVRFGVLALKKFVHQELSDRERREREEWAFEVAILMRDRFLAYEIYDEWFGHKISRATWRELLSKGSGMAEFRQVMYGRLARNLQEVGLLSSAMEPRWGRAGLARLAPRPELRP
jgi:hypothetical protein